MTAQPSPALCPLAALIYSSLHISQGWILYASRPFRPRAISASAAPAEASAEACSPQHHPRCWLLAASRFLVLHLFVSACFLVVNTGFVSACVTILNTGYISACFLFLSTWFVSASSCRVMATGCVHLKAEVCSSSSSSSVCLEDIGSGEEL